MQNQNNTTRFALIRHAQTVWNREKKIQGHSDSPLTADGEKQASSWGRILSRFSWDRILASDAGRARATAEIINAFLKVPLTIDSRLKEQDVDFRICLSIVIESQYQFLTALDSLCLLPGKEDSQFVDL